jgi:hypothetical protein
MNRYYEVKAVVKDEEGKLATKLYVAKSDSTMMADTTVQMLTKAERIAGVNEKNWINVFNEVDKIAFYECKVEAESLDGKPIVELYLQKADSTHDAETLLLKNIEYKPEFKSIKETKIIDSY